MRYPSDRYTFRLLAVAMLFVLLSFHTVTAQDEEITWVPLDSPQLSQNEVQWLSTVTQVRSEYSYRSALDFIGEKVNHGQISSADRAAVQLLTRIVTSPYDRVSQSPISDFAAIDQRVEALIILAEIGGEYSLQSADQFLQRERDPVILRQVFGIFEAIAPPFNERRYAMFASHLRRAVLIHSDEYLAQSIVDAIDSMYQRTWTMTDQELFNEILGVVQSPLGRALRTDALNLAKLIAGVEIDGE